MKNRANEDIRTLVKVSGVRYQDIAREMDINPYYLSKLMSEPLSILNRKKIVSIVADKLKHTA